MHMLRRHAHPRGRAAPLVGSLAVAALALVALLGATAAPVAAYDGGPVAAWARRHAEPLATVDPAAPIDYLAPLRRSIGAARVVGLGESTHGAAEEITLKHRALRFLVEELGFRSVAWEEDWTTGVAINDYIAGGDGDLDELMGRMSPQYQFRQVADVLRWLRAFNAGRADKVQSVGVEYYFTGRSAYDAVEGDVARNAPQRLAELRQHLEPLRPTSPDPFDHIAAYRARADKQPSIDHAHAVFDLVASIDADDRAHALALHDARQIVSFHEHYRLPLAENVVYRDARAAEALHWWEDLTGDRVAYWAASAHTAVAPELRLTQAGGPDLRYPSVGSYLHRWYGDGYRSIGFTFDHGTVSVGGAETATLERPEAQWFEHPLGEVGHDPFLLDLRERAPRPVRRWLDRPVTTRGLPDAGPGAVIGGGSLGQWFDVGAHRQTVSAASPA
jgi:erythromycin esterase